MLRCKESIRLSALDHELYARVAATTAAAPTTVSAYNQGLQQALGRWGGGATAAERLLAQMAHALMLDPADPSDVLGERQLKQSLFN